MFPRIKRLIPVLFLAVALVSCNMPISVGIEASPQPTTFDLAATLTALAPSAPQETATEEPVDTAEPVETEENTEVPVVGITPVKPTKTKVPVVGITPVRRASVTPNTSGGDVPASASRINFAPNATQSTRDGTVGNGQMREYVVRALAGQIMIVGLFTPDQNAVLSVYAPATGQVFLSKSAGLTDWQGILPGTMDYVLRVTGTGGTATFNLQVTIAEKIQFKPGAISASRSYPIGIRDVHTFSLRAMAGQTMTAEITSPGADVLLTIYGFEDGQPYKRYQVGDPSYSFELPATQDYIIQAVSVRDTATKFTLDVTVE